MKMQDQGLIQTSGKKVLLKLVKYKAFFFLLQCISACHGIFFFFFWSFNVLRKEKL